jgi:hypothetical protein
MVEANAVAAEHHVKPGNSSLHFNQEESVQGTPNQEHFLQWKIFALSPTPI